MVLHCAGMLNIQMMLIAIHTLSVWNTSKVESCVFDLNQGHVQN